MRRSRRTRGLDAAAKRGFTLLEVVLALAILVGAIAVIGELVRLGVMAAGSARDQTQAQLLCESTMAEIAAGILPTQAAQGVPLPYDPEWVYHVALLPVDAPGMMAVQVTVVQVGVAGRPAEFSLTRWIRDPGIELPAEETETTETNSSTTSSSGQSTAGQSTGSGS